MRIFALLLLCILLFSPVSVLGGQPPATSLLEQGKRSFEAGQYEQAYDLFWQAFRQNPADLEISFYLGRAAFEKKDYEAALMAYDRILLMQPDTPRVKLELARTHLELGAREEAKRYFNEVLATNPPEQVRRNIETFLNMIELAEKRSFWSGMVSAGVNHDDNVRVAPLDQNIRTVFGIQDLGSVPESDYLYTTTTVLNHLYKFTDTPYAWKTGLINYNAFYDTEDDLDISFLGITTGLLKQSERWQGELFGTFNHLELDYDRYLGAWGLGSTLNYIVSDRTLMTLSGSLQQKDNYQDKGKDAVTFSLGGGPIFISGPNRFTLSLTHERENAQNDANSYRRFVALLRYDRQLPYDVSLFGSFRFEDARYEENSSFLNLYGVSIRADQLRDLSAGLAKVLWRSEDQKRNLAAQLSFTHTRAESSIEVYTYRKNVIATSLSLVF